MWSSDRTPGWRCRVQLAAGAVLLAASPAQAGDFDGSKNVICAPVEVNDCVQGEGCVKALPGDVGAPAFIRIDFGQQAMVGPKRSSPIKVTERGEQALLLMGTELGYGWTVVLDQSTGEMTATMTNGAGSFVFFGACTPL